jgi:hypothetical protein
VKYTIDEVEYTTLEAEECEETGGTMVAVLWGVSIFSWGLGFAVGMVIMFAILTRGM